MYKGGVCGGCTVVKAVEAVDQDRQGIRAIGFGQFVAASDAIWRRIKSLVRNKIYSSMQCLQHQKIGKVTKYVLIIRSIVFLQQYFLDTHFMENQQRLVQMDKRV